MDNMNVEVESKQQTNVESQSKSEAKKPQEDLISLTDYARELAKHLPKEVFKRDPWRLQYFFYCYAGALGLIYAMYAYDLAWYFKLPMAILAGTLSMGLGFLAHEILHGSVIKSKFWQDVFCFFGLGTFFIGPTYWRYNHNVLHHGNTQLLYKDPDAFPTQGIYKRSKFTRMQFPWTPGSGTFRSFTYFFFFFTFKVFLDHLYFRFAGKMFDNFNKKRAYLEFFACFAIAIPYIYFIGSKDPLFLIVIPYMVQNWTAMSYISTNHNLCPYTRINDPLVNSLTVTNNPLLERLHMGFGYHTEHHIFPRMSMKHAKTVSKKLQELYPDRYKIMPKWKAVKMLYQTPRVYKNRTTLINPLTGREVPAMDKPIS